MAKKRKKPLPRYWKKTIARITRLRFCDRSCDCGENNQLWWTPVTAEERRHLPSWLPGWMNGGDTHEIWNWLVENNRA